VAARHETRQCKQKQRRGSVGNLVKTEKEYREVGSFRAKMETGQMALHGDE